MVIADHARDFPRAVFVLPQMNELAFAHSFGVVMAGMVKPVNAHLNKAVTLHVVDLQRSGNKFAGDFAADIFLDAVGQGRLAKRKAALIVVELNIVDKGRCELVEITFVVGIEQSRV